MKYEINVVYPNGQSYSLGHGNREWATKMYDQEVKHLVSSFGAKVAKHIKIHVSAIEGVRC